MLGVAIYIQPLEGELTRLGSYAERDFGWNLPQKKIRGDANLTQAYKRYYDVLIIGDSFSTNGVWQPYFRKETGFSYVTLNIRKTSFHDLLGSQTFRTHPPKVVIVQCVERELVYFFRDLAFLCRDLKNKDFKIAIRLKDPPGQPEYYEEVRKTFDIRSINLRYAASVMVNTLIRNLLGRDLRHTQRFALSTNTLFSNTRNNEILVYEGDMDKLTWKQEDIARSVCSIRGLQDQVQSNGKTLFIFMLATDKSSAYADYLARPVFKNRMNTQQWLVDYGINAPRIDLLLKEAIDRGEKDIYIPSGTHWSAQGYKLAAEGLADFIRQRATVTKKSS